MPERLRRELARRILSYKAQEQEQGGLRVETIRRLDRLAGTQVGSRRLAGSGERAVKPGTRLIREWHNQAHVVTVEKNGYEYRGLRYRSLSEVARRITGTRWSGPLFFGLKPMAVATKSREGR